MKKLLTELDVIKIYKDGSRDINLDKDTVVTPLALDRIKNLGITLSKDNTETSKNKNGNQRVLEFRKCAIGSDHTGFKLKTILSKYLRENGYQVIDVGTFDERSCDYPDFAIGVVQKLLEKNVDFGIIIDATGNPSAITANKFSGIRAANCFNEFTAKSSREHNNANVLTIGAKAIGDETALSILDSWLRTEFAGGRHQRRLDKIIAVEKKNLKA